MRFEAFDHIEPVDGLTGTFAAGRAGALATSTSGGRWS